MKESKREEQGKNETELLHLTSDTLTKGDKKKKKNNPRKSMPAFIGRDPWASCLVRPSAKLLCSSGLLPRSLPPEDPYLHNYTYQVFYETWFFIKSKHC